MAYHNNHSNAHKTYVNGGNVYEYTTDIDNLPKKGTRHIDWNKSVGRKVYHKTLGGIKILSVEDKLVSIMFLRTGTIHTTQINQLVYGAVKDVQQPSVFDVGVIGFVNEALTHKNRSYRTWCSMIQRCYDKKFPQYKNYGGAGVTVCDRWLRYEYFAEDIKNLENYNEWVSDNNYQLDKDMKAIKGQPKQYSLDTCIFLHRTMNVKVSTEERRLAKLSQTSSEAL